MDNPEFAGQLFFRATGRDGLYLVCGLVRTNQPVECESIYPIEHGSIRSEMREDVKEETRGYGLDGIMTSPLWRMK